MILTARLHTNEVFIMRARLSRLRWLPLALFGLGAVLLYPWPTGAGDKKERDIFDHEAHKAASRLKRIALVADTDPHGPRGNHEFVAAAVYLARTINAQYPDAYAAVYTRQRWPKDLSFADAIVVLMNHGGSAVNPTVKATVGKGAGFMAVHYGVEVNKGEQGEHYLKWLGGYFEPYWSVNPFWTPEYKDIPKHETTRGVKPFATNDEWYYHMRFVEGMKGVTPVLSALPPLQTTGWKEGAKPSSHGGNPDVYKAVAAGEPQVMAWAYERPDKGRGFGFTGLHKHANLGNDSMRTLLLNAVAWVAKLPVPETGIPSKTLTRDELEQLIDDGKLAVQRRGI
jgi:Trehalose utilisation